MYWQVYLHKTGLVAENMMVKLLQRAKELADKGEDLKIQGALDFFLNTKITEKNFTEEVLETFSKLDDIDVFSAVKTWIDHSDMVLSTLSKMIFYRKLFKIDVKDQPIKERDIKVKQSLIKNAYKISDAEANYFVFSGSISNQAYNKKQPIKILNKKGKLKDIAKASDQLNLQALSKPVVKHFICYPKKMLLA